MHFNRLSKNVIDKEANLNGFPATSTLSAAACCQNYRREKNLSKLDFFKKTQAICELTHCTEVIIHSIRKKYFFPKKSFFFNIGRVNMQLLHIVWREKDLEVNGAVAVISGIKSRLKTFICKNN